MEESTIVLTSDLSLLESNMPTNTNAKTFQDDVENDVVEPSTQPQQRSIFGVIKVFLANLQNCTVIIKCKIITGTVELHNCQNVNVQIEKDATVATLQIDLSSNIYVDFHDAVSGKHVPGSKNILYWGEDKDDRIFHAGVTNMRVRIYRDGIVDTEITADYLKDGAEQIGNSSPEEYQFVTSCIHSDSTTFGWQLITENVVRAGNTTGTNVRAMTPREIAAEKEKRDKAAKYAIRMADDMVQVKDKDGNVLVKKTTPESKSTGNMDSNSNEAGDEKSSNANNTVNDDVIEEVYTSMSRTEIQTILDECDQLKARGNEAFGAGEYGQAILHYSLCLDKAAELPDITTNNTTTTAGTSNATNMDQSTPSVSALYPRDVIFSNRSAAFLKLGQHDKAEQDATMALQFNPMNIKANFRKGLALHASGQYAEALPILAKAYKMEPNNKQIQQAIKFCEVRLEQEYRQRMSQN
jgi:tetratricopeptide (TPR) repeat protein